MAEAVPREIYIVSAFIVDANGTFNFISGYPKTFDSARYDNDIKKTFRRADGDMSEVWGAMCKVDTRLVQTVMLSTVGGSLLGLKTTGELAPEV